MNTLPIEKVIEDENLNSVSNVFYGSKYISNNTTSDGKLATSHNKISDKCSVFDYSSSGLIETMIIIKIHNFIRKIIHQIN